MHTNITDMGKVGLGTFPFANVFSSVNRDTAFDIVDRFIDLGGRYIETAPVYPRPFPLKDILANFPREAYCIASKCVTSADAAGNKIRTGSFDAIVKQAEDELERLGVEYLDLLQAHITPEDVPPSETMRALNYLKDQGLVNYVGVSNVTLHQLRDFLGGGSVDIVQNRLSIIHRKPYMNILEFCQANGIHMNPYQVIERGQLAGSSFQLTNLRKGDLRRSKVEYSGETYGTIRDWFLSTVEPLIEEMDVTPEVLAIAWALHQPQVALCVVGATSPEQVERNLHAASLGINSAHLGRIEEEYFRLSDSIKARYGLSIEEYRGLGG